MKPRLIDRLLLGFLLLVFIAVFTGIILCLVGVVPYENTSYTVDQILTGDGIFLYIRIGIIAVCAILGIIAIKLLFTSGKPKVKEETNNASLLMSDENGSAYISAACIDSMAQKYIKGCNRIRECSSKVTVAPDSSVAISLKAIVLADTNIPELSEKVRKELKEYIETYAGVTVTQIAFMVVNTYSPNTAARIS
ncbi:MAG: alkaline shock response membrane anchor protein AmaP [Clostridia bacterium]|nr:alkaline shock response membrane anchor protein AmaP [Clostridia bacterium]